MSRMTIFRQFGAGKRFSPYLPSIWAAFLAFSGGLALSRFLYELVFPNYSWLGRPPAALSLAAGATIILWIRLRRLGDTAGWEGTIPLLPLALNLVYLFDPGTDLIGGRFIFAASIWLMVLLVAHPWRQPRRWRRLGILFVVAALLPVYLLSMPTAVGQADSFEFQVVAPRLGIAHPTGYPLYLLLGKLFTLIPFGSVAWRLNLASVCFGLAACSLIYLTCLRLIGRALPSLTAAVVLGLTATFWSQAIEAEVYALHALIVSTALLLMVEMGMQPRRPDWARAISRLALLIGIGLTNHLTTLFLIPPALLAGVYLYRANGQTWASLPRLAAKAAAFLAAPLTLYIYLPLRWLAVNGEPMGLYRFKDWVLAGRFQGALQWGLWLTDPTRYEIVGRLFMDNWGWLGLTLAAVGIIFLSIHHRRAAALLLLTFAGFTFYALNYLVPDLAVFLIPAHLVLAIFWAAGLFGIYDLLDRLLDGGGEPSQGTIRRAAKVVLLLAIAVPLLINASQQWPTIDQSADDGLSGWGQGVLELPLASNAAILADSEKIAPLYYLQQSEGMRPDLEIMVLPDELAYRSELDKRIPLGQTVYLARFLPGLEGLYYLRSMGPLTELSTAPLPTLPEKALPTQITFEQIRLRGYELQPISSIDGGSASVTLYWQSQQPVPRQLQVHLRWLVDGQVVGEPGTGQHPVNNQYPTNAWKAGEIVTDYHLVARPVSALSSPAQLQVGLAPPFAVPAEEDWRTIANLELPPSTTLVGGETIRAQIGPALLAYVNFPGKIRPLTTLPITIRGWGEPGSIRFELRPLDGRAALDRPTSAAQPPRPKPLFAQQLPLETTAANGRYQLVATTVRGAAYCGWFATPSNGCALGEVEISGVSLPQGAGNFDDRFALLSAEIPDPNLQPGGQLQLTLKWQSLAEVTEDYTIFVQLLDEKDAIVAQVDAWPVQGTYPTSQWQPGETVTDPHILQLAGSLPSGEYRLQVGFYLLATLRRLPLLDDAGHPVDDKIVVRHFLVQSGE